MDSLFQIIEWIGVLFLSVEAIKVDNFKSLTDKLMNIKTALNGRYVYMGQKAFLEAPPKGLEALRKYSWLITLLIGYSLILSIIALIELFPEAFDLLLKYLFQFKDVAWYRVPLNMIGLLAVFILAPFVIGNEFVALFSRFAENYGALMYRLEKNTYNGIIGLIGFSLISVSFVFNLLGN